MYMLTHIHYSFSGTEVHDARVKIYADLAYLTIFSQKVTVLKLMRKNQCGRFWQRFSPELYAMLVLP